MNQAGACLFAEVGRSAKGGAAFRTREEAVVGCCVGVGGYRVKMRKLSNADIMNISGCCCVISACFCEKHTSVHL